jgi:hypothetical protein
MAYKILGNGRSSGNMVWTMIYVENGSLKSELVIGPASETMCLKLAQQDYSGLIAVVPGHNNVVFPDQIDLDILLTN